MPSHETPATSIDASVRVVANPSSPPPLVQWNLMSTPQEAVHLIDEWIADASGYDEQVWPELKAGLERERTGARRLFRE